MLQDLIEVLPFSPKTPKSPHESYPRKMSGEAELRTAGRKKSVAEEQVTSVLDGGVLPIYTRALTADEEVLAALGYKPEFKREFSLWTTFCVSFAVLGLLPSFASTLYYVSLSDLNAIARAQI